MVKIITNWHRREIIDAWELSESERVEFDYLDWQAILDGRDSASFVRYRGELIDLGEFSASWGISRDSGMPDWLNSWDGYRSDSFFSGLVIKLGPFDGYEHDPDGYVIVATFIV